MKKIVIAIAVILCSAKPASSQTTDSTQIVQKIWISFVDNFLKKSPQYDVLRSETPMSKINTPVSTIAAIESGVVSEVKLYSYIRGIKDKQYNFVYKKFADSSSEFQLSLYAVKDFDAVFVRCSMQGKKITTLLFSEKKCGDPDSKIYRYELEGDLASPRITSFQRLFLSDIRDSEEKNKSTISTQSFCNEMKIFTDLYK